MFWEIKQIMVGPHIQATGKQQAERQIWRQEATSCVERSEASILHCQAKTKKKKKKRSRESFYCLLKATIK
jgi:hypothetical protein